jgi:hypothetical protein
MVMEIAPRIVEERRGVKEFAPIKTDPQSLKEVLRFIPHRG